MTEKEIEGVVKHVDANNLEIAQLKDVNEALLTALTATLIHIEEFDTRSHYPFSSYTKSYSEVTNNARQAIAKAGKAG